MPGAIQIHRQVLLGNAKISKETKIKLYEMFQRYDAIISKSDNDTSQTDLIHMYIATKPDAAPIAADPYPLALKHHDFLKQEIKNLLDARIICKSMSPWASPIVVVKKHMPDSAQQHFCSCIDYRKVNSLLSGVTPAVGTKKGTLHLCPTLH